MEVTGARLTLSRSVKEYGLQYIKFYGDGDSKSYPAVKFTYPGVKVKKLECVGHIQKRVGTHLRTFKKNMKNLCGRGKLKNSLIGKLQNYYGIAVRSNKNNLQGIKKSIYATVSCRFTERK